VPEWLASRMARLAEVMVEALVLAEGPHGVLRRLAHPFWFQSLGCVMGMDWHSSGITTSVLGALKRGLSKRPELGITICGGRGKQSRKTPAELIELGNRSGVDGESLARTSRLVAKVDSALVQDGYQLYLHGFVVARDGSWCVVQQGMNGSRKTARRYHWLSELLQSGGAGFAGDGRSPQGAALIVEPHAAIEGQPNGCILNLTDRRSEKARSAVHELAADPALVLHELPRLQMPAHHDVRRSDVFLRRLHATLSAAKENAPRDFPELLLQKNVGARTVEALAAVAEVLHGAPSRFADPARFSLAHGGKDGHPFPVPLEVYDRTISVLKQAVSAAKLGRGEKLDAISRLDTQARLLEQNAHGPSFENFVQHEREVSHQYGGMTVNGPALPPKKSRQLSLFNTRAS
jgi:hypothetical protein